MPLSNDTVTLKLGDTAIPTDIPLYQRTYEIIRPSAQGKAYKRVNLQFDGFILGVDHKDVVDKYAVLCALLDNNDTTLTYKIKNPANVETTHYNAKRVYVDSYSEPTDWKQYDGSYSFSLYYFEALADAASNLGISASYGGYTFAPIPSWERTVEPVIQDYRDILFPIGGTGPCLDVTIKLSGFLTADIGAVDPVANLKSKLDTLESALNANNRVGTLSYGGFSATVRVMGFSVPDVVPIQELPYTVTMQYNTKQIYSLNVSYQYSRIHHHPVIKEQPFCNTRSIKFMNLSGQTITYNLSCKADTLSNARAQLEVEAAARIYAGGIEIEGGSESVDENKKEISVTITRFYNTPILTNIAGEGEF